MFKTQMSVGLLTYVEPPRGVHLNESHHFIFNVIKVLHDISLGTTVFLVHWSESVTYVGLHSMSREGSGRSSAKMWVCDNLLLSDKKILIGLQKKKKNPSSVFPALIRVSHSDVFLGRLVEHLSASGVSSLKFTMIWDTHRSLYLVL